jgi:uncharacterized membrane protein YfcA
MPEQWLLTAVIFLMALLYSSVGHGGGSGYLAAMALLGVSATVMRPAALVLNLLVAGLATAQFARAGYFSWRLFGPFALGSAPLAFVGGRVQLPGALYRQLVGATLVFAAARIFMAARKAQDNDQDAQPPPLWLALIIGAVLGFVAGLTGVGGGIFLSPLLLLCGWADTRRTSAVSAAFIWVNSASGLAGQTAPLNSLPPSLFAWAAAALLGGIIGSELGRRHLAAVNLRRLLALVLLIAAGKLLFS